VDYSGTQYWSDVVNILADEETAVDLALDLLALDGTRNPHPKRFDGTPPKREPVMLVSLMDISGILNQSVVAATGPDALYWFINDHLGTPQKVIDGDQAVVWEGSQEPFGNTTVTTNTLGNNFRFPGQYFDTESGLHYNYHRYYDPSIGRYLRADPIGLTGGINLFAYAELNPINVSDQFGLLTGSYHEATGGGWASAPPRYNPSANVLKNLLLSIGTVDPTKLKKAMDKSAGPLAFYGAGASLLVAGAEIAKFGSAIMVSGGPIGWIGGGAVTLTGASMSVLGLSSIYLGYQVQQDVQYKLIDLPEILQEQGGGYCESQ
jgi:RHS repeat-associated protein